MATALKSEALPLLDLLTLTLGRPVVLECREDNTQCIAAVRSGYSPSLRHLPRTERIALSVAHETFSNPSCVLVYQCSSGHKGDVFTKRLAPSLFETAIPRLGLSRRSLA